MKYTKSTKLNKNSQKLWSTAVTPGIATQVLNKMEAIESKKNDSESKKIETDAPELDEEEGKTVKKAKKKVEGEKKSKGGKESSALTVPTARLNDLGGIDHCIEEILELIAMPISHPEIYLYTGIQPPRGILLHGPPGCGKTLLANAIAGELGVPFLQISAPSVVSGMSGESEKKLRDIFDEAKKLAPCLLFIDEIDAITPKRETAQREMERRIVAQLLTCLDDLSWDKTDNKPVIVIGATNRPDSLDPALRRAGRFDREIAMGVPDEKARERILRVMCSKLRLSGDLDFIQLAKHTPGYVGADLRALTSAAGMISVKRIFTLMKEGKIPELKLDEGMIKEDDDDKMVDNDDNVVQDEVIELEQNNDINEVEDIKMDEDEPIVQVNLPEPLTQLSTIQKFLTTYPYALTTEQLEPLCISYADFQDALGKVQPSSKREGFATVPGVTWSDIGALQHVRDELRMAVVEPMAHPELFHSVGINAPAGVLLWGPPGCGKTLLAKAVANQSQSNFISVKGPELLNKYVGESERAIRQVFARARASQPCVVFFDELDALCARRDENQSEVSARVVNTLLTELDGLESRKQVFIIAATNRPDIIDGAMLRPGRLDKLLYVQLPTQEERLEILKTCTKKTPLSTEVDLQAIAFDNKCDGFSGADLASLVREAAVTALREALFSNRPVGDLSDENKPKTTQVIVTPLHFQIALDKTNPSVSKSDRQMFDNLKVKFGWN